MASFVRTIPALALVLAAAGAVPHGQRLADRTIVIRPKGAADDAQDALNTAVAAFAIVGTGLSGAVTAIERLFDPAWRSPSPSVWTTLFRR
jgi:hypothetical protein